MIKKEKKGFTLAEVLITLSILGVIAAVLFPSILANYNERTLKAKRQALFGRMSQAMGEMADTFRNYGEFVDGACIATPTTCVDNGSAAKFVNEGLSKVYKIAAVCDNDSLTACDIPEEITRADGTTFSLKEYGTSMLEYNKDIAKNTTSFPFDTDSVGLMTKNGESILLFYNPNCSGKSTFMNSDIYAESQYCVNMIYDLNGAKKKPNKMGEDIGFISVFYNDNPYVTSIIPYDWTAIPDFEPTSNSYGTISRLRSTLSTFSEAKLACSELGDNVGLPSHEEAMSMMLNRELWAPREDQDEPSNMSGNWFWTSTMSGSGMTWIGHLSDNKKTSGKYLYTRLASFSNTTQRAVRCVYKD